MKRSTAPKAHSIQRRLMVAVLLWLLVGLTAGGFFLFKQFERFATANLDARVYDEMEDLKRNAILVAPGVVEFQSPFASQIYQRIFSGWYWQLDSRAENLDHSRSLFDGPLKFDWPQASVEGTFTLIDGPRDQKLRALLTYSDFGEERLYMAVATDRARIDLLLSDVLRFLGWVFPAIGVLLLLTISFQLRNGLGPLRRISTELRQMRDGERTSLPDDYPIELQPLAQEINHLQTNNARLVERAQRHVGNLAHALKTPLAVIGNAVADQRARTDQLDAQAMESAYLLDEQAQEMRDHIDRYLALARTAAVAQTRGLKTSVLQTLTPLANTIEKIFRDKTLSIELQIEEPLTFHGDKTALTEAFGNLLENAGKWSTGRVIITGSMRSAAAREIELTIEDDGPGIPADQRIRALKRGQRLDEKTPGSGLGLSIVQDMVDAYGGTVELDESQALGGLKVRLTLPGSLSS